MTINLNHRGTEKKKRMINVQLIGGSGIDGTGCRRLVPVLPLVLVFLYVSVVNLFLGLPWIPF